jgi:ParB family chromosome partitioning protein
MAKKTGGLGRGLGALIDTGEPEVVSGSSSLNEILISEIEPNPDQPRKHFDSETMLELSESIRQIGVVQPITLRKISDNKYQIIAGERRFRASKLAGLNSIPAYIKEVNEELMREMALVENIQREDLNAIEVALSYQNLLEICGYTQEKLSERVGKNRTTISNYLRLLRLPGEIQVGIKDGKIDMGHARALITIPDPVKQLELYNQVLKNNYSVRKVEEMVRQMNVAADENMQAESKPADNKLPEEYVLLKEQLKDFFQLPVELSRNKKGKGKVTIPFANDEELEKIMDMLESIQKS